MAVDPALLTDIDRLRAETFIPLDPSCGPTVLPPTSSEPTALATELRAALQELHDSRAQQANLRASLKKQEEQAVLVTEQVQSVQQKLKGKETEIKRLHEENLKAAAELRTLREEQASWGGQLDIAQTKYGLAEKELRAAHTTVQEAQSSVAKGESKTRQALTQAARTRREKAVVQLRRHLVHHDHRIKRNAFAALATNQAFDKQEIKWQGRLKTAHGKVHSQVSSVQQGVAKVIERCRANDEEIRDLEGQKEELEVALEEEEIKNEDLTEQLEKTEKEFEQLLAQLGA